MVRYGPFAAARKAAAAFFMLMALPAAADPVQILAFGDSLTQGYGLPQNDGFVPQLERWLNDNGVEAKVINGGVSGDTSAGGLSRIEWTLSDAPDAMLLALGGNDMLRGIDPAVTRQNLQGILQIAAQKSVPVLLIGLPASANFGPDYKAQFDQLFPELAAEFAVPYAPDMMAGMTAKTGGDPAQMLTFMQADGIHPTADGVALNVATLGPMVKDLITSKE